MKNCITLLLIVISYCSYGQTYETLKNVKLPDNIILTKKVTVPCSQPVNKGDKVVSETEYKHTVDGKTTTKTIIKEDVISTDGETTDVDKEIKVKVKSIKDGKANIYVDEKDNSIIHVNYWLNPTNKLLKNTEIEYIIRSYDCEGVLKEKKIKAKLETDKNFLLKKYIKLDNEDFTKHSDTIIKVFKSDATTVDYYLVNTYDRKVDYTFQLANRKTIAVKYTSVVLGAITIPIKYRPGQEKNDIKVKEDFSADFNAGIFAGWTVGKQKVNYQRGVGFKDNVSFWSATIGPFFSIGTTSLNKNNTTIGDTPITTEDTQNIGTVSTGLGLIKNVYNFQFGVFYGWDIGVGRDSNDWNYDGKPWWGFGIGYSLTGFWKK
ncbi:hypothetical protein [Flavobacterium orientale]|uniref:Uncharacterized protein n=1 Tax=Flavobacterium orientale TaxID=1756020 RepID=A0A916Y0Y0_9FLAO|nr:hypothetical protein [Flavobacterium orientale]GGD26354.1 hypothetical protein GCM10011343_15730 [Flavobacterium orientale]